MQCGGVFIWHETASFVWIHELMDFGRILFSLPGEGRTLQFVKFGHILSHCRHQPIRIWRKKRHLCPSIAGLYAPKFQHPEDVFAIEIKYIYFLMGLQCLNLWSWWRRVRLLPHPCLYLATALASTTVPTLTPPPPPPKGSHPLGNLTKAKDKFHRSFSPPLIWGQSDTHKSYGMGLSPP